MLQRAHSVWHVKDNFEGDRQGKWYGGGTAAKVDIQQSREEESKNGKWTKLPNSDKWEKRTWPAKNIKVAIIVWDAPRTDPCTDTVYYPQ